MKGLSALNDETIPVLEDLHAGKSVHTVPIDKLPLPMRNVLSEKSAYNSAVTLKKKVEIKRGVEVTKYKNKK